MTTHQSAAALAAAIVLVAPACSGHGSESRPANQAPTMTPAAGVSTPESAPPPRCTENFRAYDTDRDGMLSAREFNARPHGHPEPAAVFRARDHDGNGSLTSAEFCSGQHMGGVPGQSAPGRPCCGSGPEAMGPPPGQGPHRHATSPGPGAHCGQHFDAFDADRDEEVSKSEFAAWTHARGDAATLFAERDLNQDEVLTRTEFCSVWRGSTAP